MPRSALAWWPGGRTAQKAFCAWPVMTASTAFSTPPTACEAMCQGDPQVIGCVAEQQFVFGGARRIRYSRFA